ncbi:Xaa-Pro aminopeptidase [Brevibacillus aydinogluensis]|jgi:Xaa-Pro dipeptidase|uniref:Peptidase M24 n=1 Tax=Brevibacillus aydinogluensis TaxID=927786 RepID=A0AA48M9I3_9BACL|nr:aminopeptidase P family protein [Brevibacillus aydinogluensis]MDT3416057.1 Xaa-Pro aminopeptidase [Brevibacillus aydinogluensis]REK65192.1 MAG: peptidase M24 [Brevibacillus sp.]CAJ1001517.1 Peptidase M24 [Brevibacillus aydinogluensis]
MPTEAVTKIRAFLNAQNLDGVLLRTRSNFAWATGGGDNHIVNTTELGVADLLILSDRMYCITTRMEAARIRDEELAGFGCEFVTPEWYEGTDEAILQLCAGKAVGADVWFHHLPNVASELAQIRSTLTGEEMERYRQLGQTAAKALEATCRELQRGWTEHEIAAHLAAKLLREGINPQVLLVATDERIFHYRHPIPTEKQLDRYAMLVLCAEKGGLVANATRFVHFGDLAPELEENKRKLAEIEVAMIAATRPGAKLADILQRGIEAYKRAGYPDDWRLLHQGGPSGYAPREFLVGPGETGVVRAQQAYAWNPTIRGIKMEDTFLVHEEEIEFITHTGEWVYMEAASEGRTYLRPDILIR